MVGKLRPYSHHVSFQEMSGNVHDLVQGCFYLMFVGTHAVYPQMSVEISHSIFCNILSNIVTHCLLSHNIGTLDNQQKSL